MGDRIDPPFDSRLDTIEVTPWSTNTLSLHCTACGATFGLHWDPLTVDAIVCCARYHLVLCPGAIDQ